MQAKWKIITVLVVCLSAFTPSVFAATLTGGVVSSSTGTGSSGGGAYQTNYVPAGETLGVEAGIQAWAAADNGGTGSSDASYSGSPAQTGSVDSADSFYAYALSAQVNNGQARAAVDKTSTTGTAAAYSGIYARAQANTGAGATTNAIYGVALIQTIIGPFNSEWSPQGLNGPSAEQQKYAFNGKGTAQASASGQAQFDASKLLRGTANEVLKCYGVIGSNNQASSSSLTATRDDAVASGVETNAGQTQGQAYIKASSGASDTMATSTADDYIKISSLADPIEVATRKDVNSHINGTANTSMAYAGAWDSHGASLVHTKQSNENAYASAVGSLNASASSFKAYFGSTAPEDKGIAVAEIIGTAKEDFTNPAALSNEVMLDILTDSGVQRGAASNNLASANAYIDSGVGSAVSRESATACTQVSGQTGDSKNGPYGFGAGSQLRNPVGDENSQVYAGMIIEARGDLHNGVDDSIKPSLTALFGTFSYFPSILGADMIQGARTTGSWTNLDGAGAYGMVTNFQLAAIYPSALSSVYSTTWDHQYAIGWAEGSNPSTIIGSWTDNLAFTGLSSSDHPTGRISELSTTSDQANRKASHLIRTENTWAE